MTKCQIRLYMLEGFNFAAKDAFSPSDPYLVIKCGKNEFNEQKNYQLDTANPKFYKCYDFQVDFPGAPLVEIFAYDYDMFFGDELIGITRLDLDDRYFSKSW
jgi:Ca2+-dependent lipid-binding protein